MDDQLKFDIDRIANEAIQRFIGSATFKEIVKGICDEVQVPINIETGGDMVLIPEARDRLNLDKKSTALSAAATKGKLPFLEIGPRKRIVSVEVCEMYLKGEDQEAIWKRWKEIVSEYKSE